MRSLRKAIGFRYVICNFSNPFLEKLHHDQCYTRRERTTSVSKRAVRGNMLNQRTDSTA